ncbi:MAG: glycosyltransferase family 39 protein [Parcubacteria group bacterium]|nr:glycosyltransferase family 39 protein [Parcubacteria group bacterium]
MMNNSENILVHKKTLIILSIILGIIFLVMRLPGVGLPYHQDEFKSAVSLAGGSVTAGNFFSHPPLTALFLGLGNSFLGNANLRFLPIIFSILICFLFFDVVKNRYGAKPALWGLFLLVIGFYSVWASLMIDTDGAIIPFFLLLSVNLYDRWKNVVGWIKYVIFSLFIASLVLGFLVKLSFVIVLGMFLVDFFLERQKTLTKKDVFYTSLSIVGFVIFAGLVFGVVSLWRPEFSFGQMISHALLYFHFGGRDYTQVIVQGVKSVFYLSPVLLIPLLFISKELFEKTRIFFIYVFLGLIFYFVLFDFSRGALDKYMMFLIVPLSVIVGLIISKIFDNQTLLKGYRIVSSFIIGFFIVLLLFILNFINHIVPPLYPKEEWFGRVIHLEWNILNPFNGGSGPVGFYISFIFIVVSFLISLILGIVGCVKRNWLPEVAIILIMIGFMYNAVFAEELFFGKINGSTAKVLNEAVSFIYESNDIKKILTYNDIGAYELSRVGKYAGRFYAAPQFEDGHRKKFTEYVRNNGGYFLVVDIPHINPESFYGKFFSRCPSVFNVKDSKIEATIYDCE